MHHFKSQKQSNTLHPNLLSLISVKLHLKRLLRLVNFPRRGKEYFYPAHSLSTAGIKADALIRVCCRTQRFTQSPSQLRAADVLTS